MKTTINELHRNTKEKKGTHGDDKAGLSAVWQKAKAAPQPLGEAGEKAKGAPTWRDTGSAERGRETEVQLARTGCRRTWWHARSVASSSAHSSWGLKKKKKKRDADDSGTSHRGMLRAKKGLRGGNHSCDSWHRSQALPLQHLGTSTPGTGSLLEN